MIEESEGCKLTIIFKQMSRRVVKNVMVVLYTTVCHCAILGDIASSDPNPIGSWSARGDEAVSQSYALKSASGHKEGVQITLSTWTLVMHQTLTSSRFPGIM